MVRPQRYFPWKVFRQFYLRHFFFVLATLVVTGFSIRYFVFTTFLRATDIHAALGAFDSYLTSLFLTILVFAGAYLAFTTRAYVQPLGRLIQRARELRRLDTTIVPDLDAEELNEEPGEWFDLERALNRIHKDLRTKTEALSREREELSALIGAVSEAILAIDRDEAPLFFNSQFALMFRTASGNERALALGETFRVPEVLEGFRDVLRTGQMRNIAVTLLTSHHAHPRHFSISLAPLKDEDTSAVYGAMGIFHDVTELKASEQIRIEFVGNASHELRTPLTSIKGYVATLKEDFDQGRTEEASQFLDVISRNVDRLIFLVNDLLDLSTLESGAELAKQEVSTREVTEIALRQLETKRAVKRHEIAISYLTEVVRADPRRVEQILVNLVHNAIKYTPDGSRIEVIWEKRAEGTCLRIRDNGAGIAPEHQTRLFERFYRVDPGRSREQGGTGLGLAIVKHIMIKHGGTVRLVSRPQVPQGAEFICTFPH